MSLKIVILQSRYGPYHIARLKAVIEYGIHRDIDISGLQVSAQDEYEWSIQPSSDYLALITAIPDSKYQCLNASVIRRAVVGKLNEIKPDAVVVNGYSFAEARAAINWCRHNHAAVVMAGDSKMDDAHRSWYKEKIKRMIVKACDAAHVAGSASRDYAIHLGMPCNSIYVGYDCIDNDFFSSSMQKTDSLRYKDNLQLNSYLKQPYFLSVNRFIPRKNMLGLLTAYANYRKTIGNNAWNLVLLGDGSEMDTIKSKIDTENISGVSLPGFRQVDELKLFYHNSSCFIHPALQDQWGLVVNEAMASGLPVLVSKNAGCAHDLVKDGENGWTFDPTFVKSMTDALVRVHNLSNEQRSIMGNRSRQIISNWSLDCFAQNLLNAVQTGLSHAGTRKQGIRLLDFLLLRALDFA